MKTTKLDLSDSRRIPWMTLLDEALNTPGMLSQAYHTFHSYSICNMLLAMTQLSPSRIGPIATYKHWQRLGRNVRKGEKAIALYMPISIKEKNEETEEVISTRKGFMLRRNWFSLAQTDGDEPPPLESPAEWSVSRALSELSVTQKPFAHVDGNMLGYAVPARREVTISPLCESPLRTLFHELAHVDLHRTKTALELHGRELPRVIEEVEAETVSYLVADTLGVESDFSADSRGYIQDWMRDKSARADFAKTRASRVFGCAQRIIAAGKPKKSNKEVEV